MIRAFIITGVRLYRDGLASVLARSGTIEVLCAEAAGSASMSQVLEVRPDVVLLDMCMPQSYETARALHVASADLPVIALGINNSETERMRCAEVGIISYVTDDAPATELVSVIEKAARGEAVFSPKMAGELVRKLAALARDREPEPPQYYLTRREREIVALLEQDCSNKEIAARLGIEVATVKNHVHNLLEKLSVSRRADIVKTLKLPRAGPTPAAPGRHRRNRSFAS